MPKIRWGLIGCGDIVKKRVAPALKALKQCELKAVSRANYSLVESFAKEFDIPRWYKHWEELLEDKEIDAVYIATPVSLHAEQTIAAAKAGKHILCEKPMGMNIDECERMIDECKANHVQFGVAYYRHFYPVINRIKEIISLGEIGDIVLADIQAFEWFDRMPGEPRAWLLEKEKSGGGPMMDFGCHRIEVFQNLFGTIKEMESRLYNIHFTEREVEDSGYLSLQFESGPHAILRVSHAVKEARDSLDIFGTKGSLHVPVLNEGRLLVETEKGKRKEFHPPHENVHQPLIEDFTKSILENRLPAVGGQEGKEVSIILDRIYSNFGEENRKPSGD